MESKLGPVTKVNTWWAWWAVWHRWSALAVSWQAAVGLTLLTEDAVEWVLTWFGWWGNRQLDVHKLGPCRISVYLQVDLLTTVFYTLHKITLNIVQK